MFWQSHGIEVEKRKWKEEEEGVSIACSLDFFFPPSLVPLAQRGGGIQIAHRLRVCVCVCVFRELQGRQKCWCAP